MKMSYAVRLAMAMIDPKKIAFIAKQIKLRREGTSMEEVKKGGEFGWELILNLYDCDLDIMSSGEEIQRYAKELCVVIDMVPYGEPQTPYFGLNNEYTKGYSLLQFIETSSITGHFSEARRACYINIFSCKPYDAEAAKEFSAKFFKSGRVESTYLTRQ